ncbi:MAG TPA: hypothetical protein DD648_08315 [Candidatus Omnitrophica bacterium]|nr:hypothetical protein [Candidatus Omnitrophota bacterium]
MGRFHKNRKGQNITEYMILVAGVLVVVILAANPRGIFTQGVNKSLERMLDIECMSLNVCPDAGGCPYVCGNGCCEKHSETPASCPMDCECATDAECVDSFFCTVNERCVNSRCVSAPIVIDDGIACTMDSCDEAGDTIVHAPDNSVCDNALACDGVETCNAASGCQAGTPINVDDGIACTVDSCADPAGTPVHTPNNAACGNGQFCDGSEVCNAASGCQAGTPPNPDDGVPCTVDSCNETADTLDHTPNDALCNDGQFCNGAETCTVLGCQAGVPPNCSDGNACNGVETCDAGVNACVAGTPLSCDDGNICNGVESCDPAAGCVQIVPPLVCDDGDICNGVETCNAVTGCQAGTPLTCNDGDICNGVESCDSVQGCVQVVAPLTCNDNNVCNGVENCNPVSGCQAGTPLTCDDSDLCNGVWNCDAVSGCLQTTPPVTCSDGNVCNGTETCNPADGSCQAGTPVPISDGIACTDDNCDTSTGAVTHTPNNSLCPGGYCDAGSGCINYQCLGSPSGTRCSSGWDTSDETGLSADSGWSLVSSCTAAGKCEYTCGGGTVYYSGSCCTPACPLGSCGTQNNATTCGIDKDCGTCCGNGAIDAGEVCDTNGPILNGRTCADSGYTGTGTPGCSADCIAFTQGTCCNVVNGTWGGWGDYGTCGQYVTCIQREHATTCSATCGGSCPAGGDYRDTKACGAVDGGWGNWVTGSCSVTCGGGTQTDSRTCNNPSPSCGGLECLRADGTRGLTETTAPYACNTQACPQWVAASPWGTQCNVVCAGAGMVSGSDPWGKNCRSNETCGCAGACGPISSICTDGEGGISGNTSTCRWCPRGSGCTTWYDCRNSGQKHDCNRDTDAVALCYCI